MHIDEPKLTQFPELWLITISIGTQIRINN